MVIRELAASEVEAAGGLLHEAYARAARERGFPPPWHAPDEVAELAARYRASEPEGALAGEDGGALVAVGFARRRGEVATIGPLAAARPGAGAGSKLLDELIGRAEHWGCGAIRLYQDAWNPNAFALYAGRSFAVVDVVAHITRPAGAPPRIDAARGLEIVPVKPSDHAELAALDVRLTGLERRGDLETSVKLVARRRGAIVGFLGAAEGLLGPAVALDVSDLFALVARALVDLKDHHTSARLSTAAPTAMLAALALGFRVVEVGTMMSRGVAPAARPPQLYSIDPEVL
jgi:GNAT superfamily N-acetyltransferase